MQPDPGFDHLRRPFIGAIYQRRWPSKSGDPVRVKVLANEVRFMGVPHVKAATTWGNGIAHYDLEAFYRDFHAIENVVPMWSAAN